MRYARTALCFAVILMSGCRKDVTAPSASAADQELAEGIVAAGGRAMIGFKEAGAPRGVDERGTVLVSDETQARARSFLRDQGVEVVRLSINLPSVEAHFQATPELVARLRANPTIDYIEPVTVGTFSDGRGL